MRKIDKGIKCKERNRSEQVFNAVKCSVAAIFEYCGDSKLLFQEKEERLQQCLMKLQAAEASSEC